MRHSPLYRVFIDTHFAASHQLHGYQGACRALHGHTWKVRIEIKTTFVDDVGISFDFKMLKELAHQTIDKLDHNHINDIPPFDELNPTAEHISRYIYDEIKVKLPEHAAMSEVTVWESDSYAISYSEK